MEVSGSNSTRLKLKRIKKKTSSNHIIKKKKLVQIMCQRSLTQWLKVWVRHMKESN